MSPAKNFYMDSIQVRDLIHADQHNVWMSLNEHYKITDISDAVNASLYKCRLISSFITFMGSVKQKQDTQYKNTEVNGGFDYKHSCFVVVQQKSTLNW